MVAQRRSSTSRRINSLAADDIYDLVERAMEYAFEGKYLLNFYALLEGKKAVKREVDEFLSSSTAVELHQAIEELSGDIRGGDLVLKEAYGHIPKPQARKIRTYLTKILDDALRYSYDKRPGRKKKIL